MATPWPREVVKELIFLETFGWVGVATPGISLSILERHFRVHHEEQPENRMVMN